MVPLAEVLTQHVEYIDAPEPRCYPKLSVKLYGRGVALDAPTDGTALKMKRHQLARAGQVILSEIWGKKGAIGIVPPEGQGALCTSHFFLFDLREERIDRGWLRAIFRANYLQEQLDARARGTTGYAAVRPKNLLVSQIPLPPLAQQRRIVAKTDQLAAKIAEAHGLHVESHAKVTALPKAVCRSLVDALPNDCWTELRLCILDIVNGWSPACLPQRARDGEWGVLKVGAVSFGRFDPSQNKALPVSFTPKPELQIRPGQLLMTRANTRELVGASAYVHETPRRLLLCDKIFRFEFLPKGPVEPRYVEHVLKSPPLRDQIEREATGTSPTMKNISKAKILALRLPVPSLDEQRRIVGYLDHLQAKVDRLKTLQNQTGAELDALLPSVLDRAFRGEL